MDANSAVNSKDGSHPVYLTISAPVESGVDLQRLWMALVEGKWIIAVLASLCVCGGMIYSLFTSKLYEAEVLLAPVVNGTKAGPAARLGGLASLAGLSVGGGDESAETIAMLKSKAFLGEFIRSKHLLPILFEDQWDPVAKNWRSKTADEIPDYIDGVQYFLRYVLDISRDGETGFVTLRVRWKDPKVAAVWAMELVARGNNEKRQKDTQDADGKLAYLHRQLETASLLESRQAIANVIEDQLNATMMAHANAEYAFKIIDPAIVPKVPVWPQLTLLLIATAFVGLFVGVSVVLIRAVSRGMIVDRKQHESVVADPGAKGMNHA